MINSKSRKTGQKRKKRSLLPGTMLLLLVIAGTAAALHFTAKLQPLIDRARELLGQAEPPSIQEQDADRHPPARPPADIAKPEPIEKPIVAKPPSPSPKTTGVEDDELAAKYRKRFKKPVVGKPITLALKGKAKQKGILEHMDEKSVTIKAGSAVITLARKQLGPAGLARCYEDDYVSYMVALHRRRERQAKARRESEKKMMAEYEKFMTSKGRKIDKTSAKAKTQSIHDIDFKEWMEKNGATEMLKARQQRIKAYEAERIRAGRAY